MSKVGYQVAKEERRTTCKIVIKVRPRPGPKEENNFSRRG